MSTHSAARPRELLAGAPVPRHRAETDVRPAGASTARLALTLLGPPALVLGAFTVGWNTDPAPAVSRLAHFGHVAFLAAGLGAVLAVDFQGLRWVRGRITLVDLLRFARTTDPLIWIGYVGLAVTGALLAPSAAPLTLVKLVAAVVVGWNGIVFHHRSSRGVPATWFLVVCATVSQLAWWTAAGIGMWNSTS